MAEKYELNGEELNQVSGGGKNSPTASSFKYSLGQSVTTDDQKKLVVQKRGYINSSLTYFYYYLGTTRDSADGHWYLCNAWGDLSYTSKTGITVFDE